MNEMKVAIILARGAEGCGVTRYALEEQKWYRENGHTCDIYYSTDKKWPRQNSQENDFIPYKNSEIILLRDKLNDNYDIVYYQSLPSKNHSEEYCKLFLEHLVKGVTKPIKISHQNDHKLQSLSRNYEIWTVMSYMDASFTHSYGSPFAKKMKELNPRVPILKMGLGFDFDSLKQFWKPVNEQVKRISYFGRFAGFKDPIRIIDMQPYLEKYGFIGEMKGIERSIGSLDLFYTDLTDRKNSYRKNIYEVKAKETINNQTTDKVWIYGPYNRLEGIEELSKSMFGADFYNLDKDAYGDNMEFAMCEIIACGAIPVFDKHWADNCKHLNGKLFTDIKDFAIYSDRSDLEGTVRQMDELANNPLEREKRRSKCLEWAKSHCDNDIIYKKMHDDVLSIIDAKKNGNIAVKVDNVIAEKEKTQKVKSLF